jgi:hypothetical protein
MTFDNLVPNGTYTVWCAAYYGTALNSAVELPCGNPDGSENSFKADQSGRAHVRITMTALPPSTVTAIQEIAIAYHSDGQTHGPMLGEHGHNAHVQLWFDFFPPGFVPPNAVPPTNP